MCVYLSLRGVQGPPVVGSELVELIELQAYVLDGQLQHVPKPGQVRGHGTGVGVGVL